MPKIIAPWLRCEHDFDGKDKTIIEPAQEPENELQADEPDFDEPEHEQEPDETAPKRAPRRRIRSK